ncbi:CMP-N-acetylneuraminate-beta-galactosamide-alpha-2,3-sialyltransferase 4 isoform X3 [Seriola aureovittata]|uniref:CMP-N-acetylneuraminate-beta-galactosamide- alpha-2,3-sialyltransferase 4 isoform X3 n=1 Tax=Seriola aureovittata TaxID=2871759 RepID=UPI0024BEF798|nr:CMP-N-acetylneuraminate-beta-galactosamide-alpha-2,3-sialyltransferase 4 isoform X3 [Seriola aureovittata]
MSQNATKTWCLRLVPVLFFISFVTYYCSDAILQSISRRTQLFLKLEDFFWREHLSALELPYGIKGSELVLLKVLAVTANYQVPANIEKLECRTCVVIGNGFAIKNSSLGSIINKYDVVIRGKKNKRGLNNAPVKGYEEDVGNKTTMRFFYPESASYNPGLQNEPGTLMVLVPFKQQDLRWLKEILYNEKRVRKGFWKPPPQIWLGDVSKIRVLDPHFLHQTADRLLRIPLHPKSRQPVHPTTGILAVVVALNYCDVVHIAGFGYPNSKSQRQPIHYYGYDTMRSMKNSYHDLNHEADALKRLEDSGAIMYLHPHL